VKSQFGYHIIQVIAREELPASASQYEQIQQTAFSDWLTKTNEDAKTAGTLLTYDDVWKANLPTLPAAISQLLSQSQQQPQVPSQP
jgi:hypothetical protein